MLSCWESTGSLLPWLVGTELCRLVLCMGALVCGNSAQSHLLMSKNFLDKFPRQSPQGQGLLPALCLSV